MMTTIFVGLLTLNIGFALGAAWAGMMIDRRNDEARDES